MALQVDPLRFIGRGSLALMKGLDQASLKKRPGRQPISSLSWCYPYNTPKFFLRNSPGRVGSLLNASILGQPLNQRLVKELSRTVRGPIKCLFEPQRHALSD